MQLKFGDCVLDLRARQLVRAGKIVPLEPKMYELLEVLITRRGSVVKTTSSMRFSGRRCMWRARV
jgi:DNA-binding winged helix-turn-helix (wHTH) protein